MRVGFWCGGSGSDDVVWWRKSKFAERGKEEEEGGVDEYIEVRLN